MAGWDLATNGGFIAQLSLDGVIQFSASLTFPVVAMTIDGLGRPFVTVITDGDDGFSVERLEPDGSESSWIVSLPWEPNQPVAVAADQNGDAWIFGENYAGNGVLWRFDSQGNQTLLQAVAGSGAGSLAVDSAGNAYIGGYTAAATSMKNSLATCGTSYLAVYAPDGSLLQSTYVPGAGGGALAYLTTGPNSTIYAVAAAPGEQGGSILARFSPNPAAQTVPLACMGSAATYGTGPIAPGEIVTLFGSGLGPVQGMKTQATLESPFPTMVANVEVIFDGKPAPLLWVQDAQINVVVPWELTPGQTTQVCVLNNEVPTNCLTWPVVQTAPGVFTVDGTYAAALNGDGTINSAANPAKLGSVVSVFATGLGPINPPQADGSLVGLPLPLNQISATASYAPECSDPLFCANLPLTVYYAGPAPFELAGLTQINVQTPPVTASAQYPYAGEMSISGPYQGFRVYLAGP